MQRCWVRFPGQGEILVYLYLPLGWMYTAIQGFSSGGRNIKAEISEIIHKANLIKYAAKSLLLIITAWKVQIRIEHINAVMEYRVKA